MNYNKLVELYNNYMSGNKDSAIEEVLLDLFKRYDGDLKFLGVSSSRPSWNDGDEINTYIEVYQDLESFVEEQAIELDGYCNESAEVFYKCGYKRNFALPEDHEDYDEYDYEEEFIEVNKVDLPHEDLRVIEFFFENFVEPNCDFFITYDDENQKLNVYSEDREE